MGGFSKKNQLDLVCFLKKKNWSFIEFGDDWDDLIKDSSRGKVNDDVSSIDLVKKLEIFYIFFIWLNSKAFFS